MSGTDDGAFLSLKLDADLLVRLEAYAQADRRAVCAAVHAWVDEILAPRGDGFGARPSEEDR